MEFPEELELPDEPEFPPLPPLPPFSFAKAIDPNSSIPEILLTTILLVTEYEKMVAKTKIKDL